MIPVSTFFRPKIRGQYHLYQKSVPPRVVRQLHGHRRAGAEGRFRVRASSSRSLASRRTLGGWDRRTQRWLGTGPTEPPGGNDTGVSERIVSAPSGIDFRVTVRNPNAPYPCLCLPGALGTGASDFANLLYDADGGLGPGFGIYALDPRGLGGSVWQTSGDGPSQRVERDYPIDFYVRDALDAAGVMEALGFDRYAVLGWSDGANSAIHLAAHPDTRDKVGSLVVWGGNASATEEDAEAWESLRDVRTWSKRAREEKRKAHGGSLERLQELNDAATDGWIRLCRDPRTRGDVCRSVLHRVRCPTAVFHGSRDAVCEARHADYLSRQIPDATLTVFPEGKHNLHQKHASTFHALVRGFLEDTTGEGAPPAARPFLPAFAGPGAAEAASAEDCSARKSKLAIDEIAYGFMGSKALSVALKVGVFDAIDTAAKQQQQQQQQQQQNRGDRKGTETTSVATLDQILSHCQEPIPEERLRTLLSACVALKLIDRRVFRGREIYSLPKASADQLVRSSKHYWGDYIVGQVDAQFYTRMKDLDQTILTGDSLSDGYEAWFESDPEAAQRYTLAQHNGSLATGYGLLRRLPELSGGERFPCPRMLDVGGGSGAFSIATARTVRDARCVVLDLPSVARVARDIISREEKDVRERLSTLALSATAPDRWAGIVEDESFDVVLMSYVSGSIPVGALSGLYKNAYRALKPGGIAIVHDFFVGNNGDGPRNAALWALAHVTVNPEGMGLRPGRVTDLLLEEGFVGVRVEDMIPETTQLVVATKPGG